MDPNLKRGLGATVLIASLCGYPLTQMAVRRWGKRGAALSEAVCAGLFLRDAAMVASGTTGRIRKGPATLLWMELGVAAVASIAGVWRLFGYERSAVETTRRVAVGALFGLHTMRFWIYLQPGGGRRETPSQAA